MLNPIQSNPTRGITQFMFIFDKITLSHIRTAIFKHQLFPFCGSLSLFPKINPADIGMWPKSLNTQLRQCFSSSDIGRWQLLKVLLQPAVEISLRPICHWSWDISNSSLSRILSLYWHNIGLSETVSQAWIMRRCLQDKSIIRKPCSTSDCLLQ